VAEPTESGTVVPQTSESTPPAAVASPPPEDAEAFVALTERLAVVRRIS
jgi:hypothetical protein